MNEAERKGWTFLTTANVIKAIPRIIDIVLLITCGCIVGLGAKMFKEYGNEMQSLIDAGDLPMCVYGVPSSLGLMMFGLILILFWHTRRH